MSGLRILILAISGALLTLPVSAAEWPTIRLCYEATSLAPYTSAPAQTQGEGLVLDLLKAAALQAQVRLDLHQQPWKRCIHEMRQGSTDGIFVTVWQADRDVWGRFPGRDPEKQLPTDPLRALWPVEYVVIARSGGSLNWDGQHFSGVVNGVGAPLGYVTSQRLQALGVLASESMAPAKALRMVAAGRLDGYVLEHEIGLTLLRELQLDAQLELLPTPLLETEWYLPFSHQFYAAQPALAERFWKVLGEQRQQMAAELRQRYLASESRRCCEGSSAP